MKKIQYILETVVNTAPHRLVELQPNCEGVIEPAQVDGQKWFTTLLGGEDRTESTKGFSTTLLIVPNVHQVS